MTVLNFGRDVQGYNAFAPAFCRTTFSASLAAAGNSTVTVPSTAENWTVSFSFQPGSVIWVALNQNAAAPAGGSFAANHSELLTGSRQVKAGDTINFYNNGTATSDIGVILYVVS